MNCGHDVAKDLSDAGMLNSIVQTALTGEVPVVPAALLASRQDVEIAVMTYRMYDGLARNEKQDVPLIDDAGVANPAWWDVKAKVRSRNGDLPGAIADAMRALKLKPNNDAYNVCLGHYLRDQGFLHLAEASYRRAVEVNPHGWAGALNLAYLLIRLKRWEEAEGAISIARERGCKQFAEIEKILGRISEGRAQTE
jgi:Flp pilus assembly protein TadD